MNAHTGPAATRTLIEYGDQAEQSMRALNHLTRPAAGELTDPAEAAEVIATLASMTGMLPQLVGQLSGWLLTQHHGRRLRTDTLAPLPDVGQAVQATAGALAHAAECLRRAGSVLDTAHQHAAHLARNDDHDTDHDDRWGRP